MAQTQRSGATQPPTDITCAHCCPPPRSNHEAEVLFLQDNITFQGALGWHASSSA